MPKIQIQVEISEPCFRHFREEARRRGVAPESLLEEKVNRLLRELECGPDNEDTDLLLVIP